MSSLGIHIPPVNIEPINAKWVQLPTETPLREGICDVLRGRSRAVLERIPPVVQKAGEDIEHVHQLRVATRRLAAVLRILRLTAPDLPGKKLARTVRKIRRLCGSARDLDVKQEFLRKLSGTSPQLAGLSTLIDKAQRRREAVQAEIERRLPRLEAELRQQSEKLLARAWTLLATPSSEMPRPTYGQLGQQVLHQEFDRLRLAAAAWIDQIPSDAPTEDLHQLRIACKKFRYATELFASMLLPGFRDDLYPQLQDMQQTLGDIQDATAGTADLLAERGEIEPRLILWLGLDSGPGASVREGLAAIDGAIEVYFKLAAESRETLRQTWNGFVHERFFEPLSTILRGESPPHGA